MSMVLNTEVRKDEKPEFIITGPFAGIQSEMPPEQMEMLPNLGFMDTDNLILRKAHLSTRPGIDGIPAPPVILLPDPEDPENPELIPVLEPAAKIFDFFNVAGQRISGEITGSRLIQWNGGAQDWLPVAGTLTDSDELFTTAVVAQKLLFSQGVDKVKVWDGASAAFADVSANAVPARFLMELDNSLIACNTIEGGVQATQRIRYTAPFEPQTWIGFLAGQVDLFNDLGPITGCMKIVQQGYIWQQWGIMQMIPQPTAFNRFKFIPIKSKPAGNMCPYSLDKWNDFGVYVGSDNVYLFDGSSAEPIGDRPIQGMRMGARSRIFAELQTVNLEKVFGRVTTTLEGTPFNAYWLFLPGASTWCYNFDEGNWMRFSWNEVPVMAGTFSRQGDILIRDLIGTIADQGWSPAEMADFNPLEAFLISFKDGTYGLVDFATPCERQWSFLTPPLSSRDHRHSKTVVNLRVIMSDINELNFACTLEGIETKGQEPIVTTETQTLLGGPQTGKLSNRVLPFKVPGQYHTIAMSGQGQMTLSEMALIMDPGGENR